MALQLVGGDEIIEPFVLTKSDGSIVDIAGVTVSGGIWWREREHVFLTTSLGGGIAVLNDNPNIDIDGFQNPHGLITLTEEQTILLPFGETSFVRLVAVTADDVTMSTYFLPLDRIA